MIFWKRQDKKPTPSEAVEYPSGVCVSTEKGLYYLKGGKKFLLPSDRIASSWGFSRTVESSEVAISEYKSGGRLGFREGSLINDISNAKLYVISENKRRHIISPDVLTRLGVTRNDFMVVSASEANLHEDGEVFN